MAGRLRRHRFLAFAWLSLDEGNNDPVRFLEYFLSALHQIVPTVRPELPLTI
jgi:ATP/maltotriose-dependent transcriptional regulator MalT